MAATGTFAQDRNKMMSPAIIREPNLPAPNLFADQLKFNATLSDLPGSADPNSTWELVYEIYFIPEKEFYSVIQRLPPGPSSLQARQFTRKILLAGDRIKKASLSTLQARSNVQAMAFKSRVPEKDKTKFSRLLTSYSVKIYDARLKIPIYHSGVFVTNIFDKGSNTAVPKNDLYLNFSVSPEGRLSFNQWAKP
jgi:hypothetical protein